MEFQKEVVAFLFCFALALRRKVVVQAETNMHCCTQKYGIQRRPSQRLKNQIKPNQTKPNKQKQKELQGELAHPPP